MKRQATQLEKIFTNYISDRALVPRIYNIKTLETGYWENKQSNLKMCRRLDWTDASLKEIHKK